MTNIFVETNTFNVESIMPFIWLGVFVIATIAEFATAELVSVWFISASIISLILSFIPGVPFFVEVIVFVVVSILQIIFLRKPLKKLLATRDTKFNSDSMIGQLVKVKTDIVPNELGEILYKGVTWSAYADVEIKKDEYVVIKKIEGNRLYVGKEDN